MALKRLVTACLAFISVICIAGCSFFDDVVHLKNDNEAILASDQNRMLLQALAEEYNASQSKYKVWLAEENAGKVLDDLLMLQKIKASRRKDSL